ncbi:MAG: O-antigen ligase family protein [Chloroflexia bacterium]|nr:O-antigen ligase family protein [Oscillatoriales cyanobacterium SM2_3_0]NJO44418.1 O-antigen ligase family protein [Oscillatoriales cyanobacterium RM2_1_1]NJO92421.1 O-antigen ligase family protein [Chloroflexia bacterium]
MEKLLKRIEVTFIVLSLIHYISGWLPLILSGGASEGDGFNFSSINLTINVFLYFLTYLFATFFLLLRWKKTIYFVARERIISAMIILTILSITWSVNPSETLRSCIGLVGTTIFGFYFGTRYSLKEQIKLLAYAYGLIILFSIFFIVLLPRYGVEHGVHAGAFRGIFTHKNVFGRSLVLGSIVFLVASDITPSKKWILRIFFGLTLVLLPTARSTSSLINATILLFALLAYRTFRLRYLVMTPVFLFFVTVGVGSYFFYLENSEALFNAIGKDPSLTGRADLWIWVGEMIEKRPWLGYGFTAFWNGLDGPSAYVIRAARWDVPYSHNGILDLLLDLGFLGLIVYGIGFTVILLYSLYLARTSAGLDGLWPLTYLTYTFMTNLSEGGLLGQNNFFWVLYTAVATSYIRAPMVKPVDDKLDIVISNQSRGN